MGAAELSDDQEAAHEHFPQQFSPCSFPLLADGLVLKTTSAFSTAGQKNLTVRCPRAMNGIFRRRIISSTLRRVIPRRSASSNLFK